MLFFVLIFNNSHAANVFSQVQERKILKIVSGFVGVVCGNVVVFKYFALFLLRVFI